MNNVGTSSEPAPPEAASPGDSGRASDDFEAAVAKAYAASVEPELWPSALRRIAGLVGPARVTLHAENLKTKVVNLIGAAADRDVLPAVTAASTGMRSNQPSESPPIGRIVVACQSEIHTLTACLLRDDEIAIALAVERPRGTSEFGRQDIKLLERLVPHLQRALHTRRHLENAELRWQQVSDVLDRLAAGLILVDGTGRVLFTNRYAQDLLEAQTGLAVLNETLHAADEDTRPKLREAIARIAMPRPDGHRSAGDALLLPRGSAGKPLTVLVSPLPRQPGWFAHSTPAAAVFVTDPDRGAETPRSVLMELYGFTKAEAALAAALLAGHGLPHAAAQQKISLNTAKTHLKRIFDKTGTRQQAELIRLILTGPGSVRLK